MRSGGTASPSKQNDEEGAGGIHYKVWRLVETRVIVTFACLTLHTSSWNGIDRGCRDGDVDVDVTVDVNVDMGGDVMSWVHFGIGGFAIAYRIGQSCLQLIESGWELIGFGASFTPHAY